MGFAAGWQPRVEEMSSRRAGPRDASACPSSGVPGRRERFAKQSRLDHPLEFKRVFRSSHRSVDRLFVAVACVNDKEQARLGLAISRKWVKKAVERNRLKRQIRESFRKHQTQLAGLDIVVMTNRAPGQPSNKQISESLQNHWLTLSKKCEQSSSQ